MKGLIDSTLREGSQTFGLAFNPVQKKAIFADLCLAGIEEIEIGLATLMNKDLPELVEFCRAHDPGRSIGLWCRCRREDILYAAELKPDVVSLSIPVSDLHIEKKFNRDKAWALDAAKSSIYYAKQLGFKKVSLGLEDSTRADRSFLKKMAERSIDAGVDRLRLADTVGIAHPHEIAELVKEIKGMGPVEVGVHMHNDFGMATANSLAALDAGAEWADVTVLGLGERAGNARLEELASYLTLHRKKAYKLEILKWLAMKVANMSGRAIDPHSPIIGERIFYCETGLHLQGIIKDSATYEPFSPSIVGATRKLEYGSKIGRKEILSYLREMKRQAANINLDEIVTKVRKKAEVVGRPLRRSEILSLITSAC